MLSVLCFHSWSHVPRSEWCIQVGVKGKEVVVIGVEKKTVLQLQDPRTVRKVVMLDDHICLAFAGMAVKFHDADIPDRIAVQQV